jgi:hypothetical protein
MSVPTKLKLTSLGFSVFRACMPIAIHSSHRH